MKLYQLLSGISFVFILLGLAGLAGAVELGTGYFTSTSLIIIGALCGVWSAYENGTIRRRR